MKSSVMKAAFSLLAMPVLLLAIPFHVRAQDRPPAPGRAPGSSIWKSRSSPEIRPRRTRSRSIRMEPSTVQETGSTGKQSSWSYKPVQGKAVPVVGRGENVTVIVTKVNPWRTTQVWNYQREGRQELCHLSKDGKIQTFHMSGTDKDGKPFPEVVVFEKQ